jgi:serpin B
MNICTFEETGRNYVPQLVGQCFKCFTDPHHTICMSCMKICHKNHPITNIRTTNAFCDCPLNCICQCSKNREHTINRFETPQFSDEYFISGSTGFHTNSINLSDPICDLGLNILKFNSNVTISPYSIFTCLALVQFGASGKTLIEFQNIMRYKKMEILPCIIDFHNEINNSGCCKTCNLIFTKINLKDNYVNNIRKIATISNGINIDEINRYVDNFTNHLIPTVITPDMVSNDTAIVLMNVIYFKSQWIHKFNKTNTKTRKFTSINTIKDIEMMMLNNTSFLYYEDYQNQVLEMKYSNKGFSMGIILPKRNALPNITADQITGYITRFSETKINTLIIPKFKYKIKFSLRSVLQKLGLISMFSNGGFYDMSEKDIYVDNVFHELVIIVDEEGTEAAATTTVTFLKCSSGEHSQTINFVANHSFTYYIRYNNLILFIGNFV